MDIESTNELTKANRPGGDFWKYWVGQTISNLGSSITLFALPLLVFKLTGSALNLGISTAANFIPYLLFGLLLGAWMDRTNRKFMMIMADIARAAIIATIPLAAHFGVLTVWWIYVVGFVHSTLAICFETGQFAAIPRLVNKDDIVTANGRIQASYSGASIIGPLLAGLLISSMPVSTMMYFDALSFIISACSLALIRTSFNQSKDETAKVRRHIGQDVIEGLRYVLGHPVLRNISLMMAMVNFIDTTSFGQLILFAKERLQASDTQVSILYAASSVGIVILSLTAGPLRKRWSYSKITLGALMSMGLLTIVLAFTSQYWLGVILWATVSGLGILFNINTSSLRQSIVPDHLLSRVMSIAGVLAWSAIPLGAIVGGAVITWTGNIVLVYAGVGVLTFLIPFAFSFTALGHAERYLPQPEEEAS